MREKSASNLRRHVIDKEEQVYVIQRLNRVTGGWENVKKHGFTRIVGRTKAHDVRDNLIAEHPEIKYRAIEQAAADQYLAGWRSALEYARGFRAGQLSPA